MGDSTERIASSNGVSSGGEARVFPSDFEERVGFSAIREAIAHLALSPLGRRGVLESTFSADRARVEEELSLLHEMKDILLMGSGFPSEGYYDLTGRLPVLLESETPLSVIDFVRLRDSLQAVLSIVGVFAGWERAEALRGLSAGVSVPIEPLRAIDGFLDASGSVRDDASEELRAIRRALARHGSRVSECMGRLLSDAQQSGIVGSDTQVAVRDGRPVLPIPAGSKSQLRGLVQGRSGSGQTLFITPIEVLELEQEQHALEHREQEEIARLLLALTDAFRPYYEELRGCYSFLGRVDTLRAKALYALEVGGAKPIVCDSPRLYLRQAHHPLLYTHLRREGRQSVGLDLELTPEQRILVISGPNAGGKSVCLKTTAVAVYMMQSGFLPFVQENSEMGLFSGLLLDIGDAQSMEDDLSTYSSHLLAMREFVRRANSSTLCLLDELGSGTEPLAGGAIAQALLERLLASGTMGVVTTHYANLKTLALRTPGFRSGSMRYDTQRLQPLYELEMDMPGSSFAFEIARKMSLPADVIARGEELAGSDYVSLEAQLRQAARDRRYWETKRESIKKLEREVEGLRSRLEAATQEIGQQQKEILNSARREARELLKASNREIERTIREIKESGADKAHTRKVRGELRDFEVRLSAASESKVGQSREETRQALSVGDAVRISGTETVGQVVSVEGRRAVVAVGQMMTTIAVAQLEPLSGAEYRKLQRREGGARVDPVRQRRLDFNPDLDIRGFRAEQALRAVEMLVDDAILVGVRHVRILHGKGDGILRQLVRDSLGKTDGVLGFGDESEDRGGAGITVVELK